VNHSNKRIAHIVPSLDVGGVEIGIERSSSTLREHFDYRVFYVRRKGHLACGQLPLVKLFLMCCTGKWRPDIVITSLWWAHCFGYLFKIFNIKWIAFFHNSKFPHAVGTFFCKMAWKRAHCRIVDSSATDNAMQKFGVRQSSIIPYHFPADVPRNIWAERPFDFIWIGRVSRFKRLDILMDFILMLEAILPAARLMIILAGETPLELKKILQETKLDITFKSNLTNSQVRDSLAKTKFYLLFSDYEGMSMTTVEAVQAGCVAVVRPVGEIPNYLNEHSCIFINDTRKETLAAVLNKCTDIRSDKRRVERMREAAYADISQIKSYTESMVELLDAYQ